MALADLDSEIVRDGDVAWMGFRSRPDPLTLTEGFASYAKNMRCNRGRYSVRLGAKRLASEINAGVTPVTVPFEFAPDVRPNQNPLTLPFTMPTAVAVTSLTRASSTATAEVVGHGFATGQRVNILGADQPEYNGDFTITVLDADTFTYELVGFPATPATGTVLMYAGPVLSSSYPDMVRDGLTVTVKLTGHGWATGRQINIRGAEQEEYNGDFVITVLDADTFTFDIASGDPLSPASGDIIFNAGPVLRSSYDGGIFAAGVFSSPRSDVTGHGKEHIVLVGTGSAYLWRDGESVVAKAFPAGQTVEPDDEVQVLQAFDRLFILRAKPLAGEWIPQAVSSLTRSSTTATATFAVAHGFTTSDRVCIEGANQAGYNHEFDVVSVPDSTTITFAISHDPVTPATGTITARKVKPPLVWEGGSSAFVVSPGGSNAAGATYSTMRSGGIACFFNSQIVMAPTPAVDSVVVSDVLDYNTFDPLLKSFRANAGSADRLVALHPFAERDVMTFMRNSIYRAHIIVASNGVDIDAGESFIELLTSEVGCRAKRTVVTAGPYIYFLADQGVYRMDLNYSDYKTRGMQVPLSDHITDLLENVNDAAMHQSCAAWFDNRYWLAVPVNGSELPNCILVWNALTAEWESQDVYPTGFHHLIVSDYGDAHRLFAVSRSGTLFLLEELETGDNLNTGSSVAPIDAELITRAYWQQDTGPKRFLRAVASMTLEGNSQTTLAGLLQEPDKEVTMATLSNATAAVQSYSWKLPVRRQAHSMRLKFSNTQTGRWTLRNVSVDVTADRPTLRGRTVK